MNNSNTANHTQSHAIQPQDDPTHQGNRIKVPALPDAQVSGKIRPVNGAINRHRACSRPIYRAHCCRMLEHTVHKKHISDSNLLIGVLMRSTCRPTRM
jgi:hypothetical protein